MCKIRTTWSLVVHIQFIFFKKQKITYVYVFMPYATDECSTRYHIIQHKILAISFEAQIWQIIYWQTLVPYWIHSVQFINILLRIFWRIESDPQIRQVFSYQNFVSYGVTMCAVLQAMVMFHGKQIFSCDLLIFSVNQQQMTFASLQLTVS